MKTKKEGVNMSRYWRTQILLPKWMNEWLNKLSKETKLSKCKLVRYALYKFVIEGFTADLDDLEFETRKFTEIQYADKS